MILNIALCIFNAGDSDWVSPPIYSYNLLFQTNILEAGNPRANSTVIKQGDSTTIFANSNDGYLFKEWKILSGIGSSIVDLNAESTRFKMGLSNTTIEAVYEKMEGAPVRVEYVDADLTEIAEPIILTGYIGDEYNTIEKEIMGYSLNRYPENIKGIFKEEQVVTYIYIFTIKTFWILYYLLSH